LKQEKLRPLVPSLAVRSASTNPAGTLGYGAFGGGRNGEFKDYNDRFDIDVQLLWEFQALGFGNRARVDERRAESEAATLDLQLVSRPVGDPDELARAIAAIRPGDALLVPDGGRFESAPALVEVSIAGRFPAVFPASTSLLYRALLQSGVAAIIGPVTVARACRRAGIETSSASPAALMKALPALRDTLRLFLTGEETERHVRKLEAALLGKSAQ
jgi:hypothetical protein